MKRDIGRLSDGKYDVLVVGGGIYGAAIARQAALTRRRVALIEQDDFGHATSSNSLKIIHGGLRYLQHANLGRMRQSIRARRTLMRIAPHLVHPLKFVIPTYGHFLRGKNLMTVALAANDLVSWDRNKSVHPPNHIPRGQVISKRECLEYIPGVDQKDLTGGAIWYDSLCKNTERLTLEFILAAVACGACVANYVQAKSFILKRNVIKGVRATEKLTGQEIAIRADIVITATGPWINDSLSSLPGKENPECDWAKKLLI